MKNPQSDANIDRPLGGVSLAKGTVRGRVEKLNVHEGYEFTLYPPSGESAIPCTFAEDLFELVQKSLRQNVTVHGLLSYRAASPYPERVYVESIDIHPPDEVLPTLASLRRLMPDATGGKTAVEFVQALRNE